MAEGDEIIGEDDGAPAGGDEGGATPTQSTGGPTKDSYVGEDLATSAGAGTAEVPQTESEKPVAPASETIEKEGDKPPKEAPAAKPISDDVGTGATDVVMDVQPAAEEVAVDTAASTSATAEEMPEIMNDDPPPSRDTPADQQLASGVLEADLANPELAEGTKQDAAIALGELGQNASKEPGVGEKAYDAAGEVFTKITGMDKEQDIDWDKQSGQTSESQAQTGTDQPAKEAAAGTDPKTVENSEKNPANENTLGASGIGGAQEATNVQKQNVGTAQEGPQAGVGM